MMWTTGRGCAPVVEILWLTLWIARIRGGIHRARSTKLRRLVPHSNIRWRLRFHSATMMAAGPTPVGRPQPQMVCRAICLTTA